MSKFFVITLVLVSAAILLTPVSTDPGLSIQGMKYLGRRQSEAAGRGRASLEDTLYFVSTNQLPWVNARKFCNDNGGSLVSIESAEEDAFILEHLSLNGDHSPVWTSGTFYNNAWTWDSTLQPFSYINWAQGHPRTAGNLVRVLYVNAGFGSSSSWQTVGATNTNFYICEIPLVPEPVPCKLKNDLVIVLDGSGSIGSANFMKAKDFVAKLASAFGSPSRTSLVVFSSNSTVVYALDNTLGPAGIEATILNSVYPSGGTQTYLGIEDAIVQLANSAAGVPRKLVVFTDGRSSNPTKTASAAQNAKAAGITTFSLGIAGYYLPELKTIAADVDDHVFTTANFDSLIELIAPVCVRVCNSG
jgi:collagen type VI alpha